MSTPANQIPASPGVVYPPSPTTYQYPGARWWKVDFHTHTPASVDYPDKNQTAEDWLKQHMAWGLDVVVVTDHNSTGFIQRLRDAYGTMDKTAPGFRPLVVFPGFELTTAAGYHLIAVFDRAADLEEVSGVIVKCGYQGTRGDSNGVANAFHTCVEIIKDSKGLTIAAHVDSPAGLLFDGGIIRMDNSAKQALESGLDAIEVVNLAAFPDELKERTDLGRLARVIGSDSHKPAHIGRNGFTLVHMTQANLEGLRMAFADGTPVKPKGQPDKGSWSVRRVDAKDTNAYNAWPSQALVRVTLDKFKKAGLKSALTIPFHPRLNVVVGGRGSGKSSIVHALRLATQRFDELPKNADGTPKMDTCAGDFWRWARIQAKRTEDGVIRNDASGLSKISVLYRTVTQDAELKWDANHLGANFKSTAPLVFIGEHDQVADKEGGAYSPERFPLSIYSQKQVLEMSRNGSGLMGIIDRERGIDKLRQNLDLAQRTYSATRAKIRELSATLMPEPQDLARHKDILAELAKVQSEAVKAYQLRQTQARALLQKWESSPASEIARTLTEQSARLGIPDIPATLTDGADAELSAAVERYQGAQMQLELVAIALNEEAAKIERVFADLNRDLRAGTWWESCQRAKADYEALGGQSQSFDPKRLGLLNQERAQIEERLGKYRARREELTRMESAAQTQKTEVFVARKAITDARQAFVDTHNAKGTPLRMTLVPMGVDDENLISSLREALGVEPDKFTAAIGDTDGARDDSLLKDIKPDAPDAGVKHVRERVLKWLDSPERITGFADLQINLSKQLEKNPVRREIIETWSPEDRLDLHYRTTEGASWTPISQGSIGQKTAAVLSFLLSFGDAPLVLDQPEDDLDTRMIMSLIVEQIRTMKSSRQIIIVTHNPNIVVHGDAELVHAMDEKAGQIYRQDASGGLQERATRKFICDVMEGGPLAFRKRFDRMGREGV